MEGFDKAFEYADKIPGAFNWLSAKHLYQHALECKTKIVEVGVDQGRSASLLLHAARQTGAFVTLVDSWESVLIDNKAKVERLIAQFPDVHVTLYHMFSVPASRFVESFGFIHIDANHYDVHPGEDCAAWLPKLESGGIACFHDYNSSFPAVTEAVNFYTEGWEDLGVWESLAVRRKP